MDGGARKKTFKKLPFSVPSAKIRVLKKTYDQPTLSIYSRTHHSAPSGRFTHSAYTSQPHPHLYRTLHLRRWHQARPIWLGPQSCSGLRADHCLPDRAGVDLCGRLPRLARPVVGIGRTHHYWRYWQSFGLHGLCLHGLCWARRYYRHGLAFLSANSILRSLASDRGFDRSGHHRAGIFDDDSV